MISQYISHSMEKSSWIRKMFETGAEMKQKYGVDNVFDLSLGNPIIEPPTEFFEELKKIANDRNSGKHRYMKNAGFEDVRNSVAENLSRRNILKTDGNHVIMSCGAGGGINVILRTLLDHGDEVILFSPFFSEYQFYVRNHHGKVVIAETDNNFKLSLDNLKKKMNQKTKAIIINNPNNPTGVVYDEEQLKEFVNFLDKQQKRYNKSIYLISDEPYREIIFKNVKVPPIVSMYDNAFLVYSWSKSLAVPGNRIGYIAVNPNMHHVKKVISGLIFCTRILGFINAAAIMQLAVKELLDTTVDIQYYEKKRDFIYDKLTQAGYDIVEPHGTFYMFPKIPGNESDLEFVDKAKEKKVLIVPGLGFGRKGYFRISYCTDDRTIEKACERLVELV